MDRFDVAVIGGGHAGIEAAHAAARLGCSVLLLTMRADRIGEMSCNPAIGGTSKGHVVREIDALGGLMAKLIDATGIQFKMLNRSKGPAMWSPRAQADRSAYRDAARAAMESDPQITVREDPTARLVVEGGKIAGVTGESGTNYGCAAAIVCSGTFLGGLLHTGDETTPGGRYGEAPSAALSENLRSLGFELGRLKTGTPARVDGRTIDYSVMERQDGDEPPPFFSFHAPEREVEQVPCWLARTSERTHEIIRGGLDRSPLFTGRIKGVGPRYCPSIEDKVVRFPERGHHQIFIEPEGLGTSQVYLNGFSSSLPADVQDAAMRSIRGLEDVKVNRWGYAVEYDFVFPQQLFPTLETKRIRGLYLAGQINGTSGYEEAAGQGLLAGINAARSVSGVPGMTLGRGDAYIGVMVDDLVTRGTREPYRLFTSRAEHRLLLRQDNADMRLADFARESSMIDDGEHRRRTGKATRIRVGVAALGSCRIRPELANPLLSEAGTSPISEPQTTAQLLRRPELTLSLIMRMSDEVRESLAELSDDERWHVETEVKYSGYLERQEAAVARQREMDSKPLPQGLVYAEINEISVEARQLFTEVRPATLGQALRIPGIRPADVTALAIVIEKRRRKERADADRR